MRPQKALLPVSWAYGAAMAIRNRCYDSGVLKIRRTGVPVISVGNLTAGGTGKTPLVAELARRLQSRGRRVGIVSRGYGRTSRGPMIVAAPGRPGAPVEQAGDEAAMLAMQLPDAIVVVAERRSEAAEIAVGTLGADVVVMDDGFQHRALWRDLNILVVDGRSDVRREPVLPAGLRREPLSGIARADLIGISKVESPAEVREIGGKLARWGTAPVFGFRLVDAGLVDFQSGKPVSAGASRRVTVMSGIGDPKGFSTTVRNAGMDVAEETDFGDHHMFTIEEVTAVLASAVSLKTQRVITTEKDAVRLRRDDLRDVLRQSTMPVAILKTRLELVAGDEQLEESLTKVLAGGKKEC